MLLVLLIKVDYILIVGVIDLDLLRLHIIVSGIFFVIIYNPCQ